MSEEVLEITCDNCADLESARRLIRSMEEGWGRHNSNTDLPPQSPNYSPPAMRVFSRDYLDAMRGLLISAEAQDNFNSAFNQAHDAMVRRRSGRMLEHSLNAMSRVIPAPADEYVKLRMADCHLGEYVSGERVPWRIGPFCYFRPYPRRDYRDDFLCTLFWGRAIPEVVSESEWTFERVVTDGGVVFWKRIE